MTKVSFDRQPTSFDVARKAGVSRSAVSRAFTPGASISADTRDKVIEAANALGYRVNELAKGLSSKRSSLVGVIVADMDTPFRAAQINALTQELVANGYHPILFTADGPVETARTLNQLLHYSLSGAVVTSDAPPSEICIECARLGVPLVLINKEDKLPTVDRVVGDNDHGGALAARELIASGCTDLIVVRPRRESYSMETRIRGFSAAARAEGLEATIVEAGPQTYDGGRQSVPALMQRTITPATGLFCPMDFMALGMLDGLRTDHGLTPPRDLCLVGYDDIPQTAWQPYRLTTIRQPTVPMAEAAVSMLIARIDSPTTPQRTSVVPVELIKRDTTR
ncbi:MAG: LacI family DNA-binding transcriptional regulator [Pseudomonadota bacterium]